MTFNFQLVTPEKTLLSEELVSLSCVTPLGQVTVLPHHAPLVTEVVSGELIVKTASGSEHGVHVAGGFLQVRPNNTVVLLADFAERVQDINEKEVEAAIERAKRRLSEEALSAEEYASVAASLERSLGRLRVVRKSAHRRRTPITSEGVLEE